MKINGDTHSNDNNHSNNANIGNKKHNYNDYPSLFHKTTYKTYTSIRTNMRLYIITRANTDTNTNKYTSTDTQHALKMCTKCKMQNKENTTKKGWQRARRAPGPALFCFLCFAFCNF